MAESMSVMTDPATYGILNSESTNCPRTAAVLGELAAQWQQVLGTLQRVEQETVSSQSQANAIGNINTRIDATGNRLRLEHGERLYPKSWSGSTPLGGFAREVAAWLGHVDPKHEAGKLIPRITRGRSERPRRGPLAVTLKTTSMLHWTVSWRKLATVTEGAARSTVLKVTEEEPSHGFVVWQALVDGYAPKSSNDPATALQPIVATARRCKDGKELKERLTAWSLRVARARASIHSD